MLIQKLRISDKKVKYLHFNGNSFIAKWKKELNVKCLLKERAIISTFCRHSKEFIVICEMVSNRHGIVYMCIYTYLKASSDCMYLITFSCLIIC